MPSRFNFGPTPLASSLIVRMDWGIYALGTFAPLHKQSFVDDPTRIFRAIRYEGRYNFHIIADDQKRILDTIETGSTEPSSVGQRIRNEIDHILSEETAPQMVNRMREFDLLGAIHPTWKVPPDFDIRWTTGRSSD